MEVRHDDRRDMSAEKFEKVIEDVREEFVTVIGVRGSRGDTGCPRSS